MNDDTKIDDLSMIDHLDIAHQDFKLRNSIYLIGGAGTQTGASSSETKILRYDIDEDKWYSMSTSHNMIKGGAVAQKNGNLAFIGGKNVNNF